MKDTHGEFDNPMWLAPLERGQFVALFLCHNDVYGAFSEIKHGTDRSKYVRESYFHKLILSWTLKMITNDNDKATESFPQELLIWANNHIANDFIHSNLQHVYSRQSLLNNLEFRA